MTDTPTPITRRWFAAVFGPREMISVGLARTLRLPPSWLHALFVLELVLVAAGVVLLWRISGQMTTIETLLRSV